MRSSATGDLSTLHGMPIPYCGFLTLLPRSEMGRRSGLQNPKKYTGINIYFKVVNKVLSHFFMLLILLNWSQVLNTSVANQFFYLIILFQTCWLRLGTTTRKKFCSLSSGLFEGLQIGRALVSAGWRALSLVFVR